MKYRTRKEQKRLIKPNGWYMVDFANPERPAAIWRWYKNRRICEERIERYFGVVTTVIPVIGQELIDHAILLHVCTNRKWNIVPHLYDYTEDEDVAASRKKRKRLRAQERKLSSR